MKKATPTKVCTPKSLLEKRVRGSKLLKIPADRQDFVVDNARPSIKINIKKHNFPTRDRNPHDEDPRNPFNLPEHKRLFIFSEHKRKHKPEPFIMSEPHTICDIDNTFYKVIEGRPLRAPGDVKIYMKNIRDITLYKANAAYLIDQLIQIDTDLIDESVEYNKVVELFAKTKNNFVQFAKESYELAKVTQEIAEERALVLGKVAENLESFSFEYVKIRNQVSAITAVLDILTRYKKFLTSISPATWREQYDPENVEEKKVFIVVTGDETESSSAPANFYRNSITKHQHMKPALYFKEPEELKHVYDDMCAQCLNYMQVDAMTNPLVSTIMKGKAELKAEVMTELADIADIVNAYKDHVEFLEAKENEYKILFHNLLMNKFQELCASEDTIKLFTVLQYTYKQLFGGSEDPKDSIVTVMLQLELHYYELTLGIDGLNQEVVKSTVNELFAEDIKVMKRAYNAQRSMRECDILKKSLYTSFEPSRATRK